MEYAKVENGRIKTIISTAKPLQQENFIPLPPGYECRVNMPLSVLDKDFKIIPPGANQAYDENFNLIPDFTGRIFYEKLTGFAREFRLGEKPNFEIYTEKARPNAFYFWENEDWVFDIEKYKQNKIGIFSRESFLVRAEILPDYRIQNILSGIEYKEWTVEKVKTLIQNFRDEFYRVKKEITKAKTQKEIDAVIPKWPKE